MLVLASDLDLLLDLWLELVRIPEPRQGARQLVFEEVAHDLEFVARIAPDRLGDATSAATAAADEADGQLLVRLSFQRLGMHDLQTDRSRRSGLSRSSHEVSARNIRRGGRRRSQLLWHAFDSLSSRPH